MPAATATIIASSPPAVPAARCCILLKLLAGIVSESWTSALVESRMGAVAWAIRQRSVFHRTGSPEAVARPRFPQDVACGFPAPTLFDSWFTALQAPAAPA